MPNVRRGRPPLFTPRYLPSGLLQIDQGTVHGMAVSYDPDYDSWCIHGEYDVVLHRFDITKPSAIRNLVTMCKHCAAQTR